MMEFDFTLGFVVKKIRVTSGEDEVEILGGIGVVSPEQEQQGKLLRILNNMAAIELPWSDGRIVTGTALPASACLENVTEDLVLKAVSIKLKADKTFMDDLYDLNRYADKHLAEYPEYIWLNRIVESYYDRLVTRVRKEQEDIMYYRNTFKSEGLSGVDKVIFSGPCTILISGDDKIIVRCTKGDMKKRDPEFGVLLCLMHRVYGKPKTNKMLSELKDIVSVRKAYMLGRLSARYGDVLLREFLDKWCKR